MCRSVLLIILITLSLCSNAKENCQSYKTANFKAETEAFEMDRGIYPNLVVNERISANELKLFLSSYSDSVWSIKIKCISTDALFFSMLMAGSEVAEFNGFFKIKNGFYFSGPHTILNSSKVIIQREN